MLIRELWLNVSELGHESDTGTDNHCLCQIPSEATGPRLSVCVVWWCAHTFEFILDDRVKRYEFVWLYDNGSIANDRIRVNICHDGKEGVLDGSTDVC